MIRVALVDDQTLIRQGVRSLLELTGDITIVAEAADGDEAVTMVHRERPDVVLLDLRMPGKDGVAVLRELRARDALPPTIVLTTFDDDDALLDAVRAGARGYLLKDGTEEDLATHIRALHAGGSPMSPLIARQLLARWQGTQRPSAPRMPSAPQSTVEPLSPRETQVLDLIARGFTYSEIAGQLLVSVTTVQTHVRNIYGKLGVHSKTEAVFEARHVGLLR